MERDKMLLQLEHECLEVYRQKVDAANLTLSRLHQVLRQNSLLCVRCWEKGFQRPCKSINHFACPFGRSLLLFIFAHLQLLAKIYELLLT